MGISDDIRPKQNKKPKIEEPEEEIVEEKEEGTELISIKHGGDHDFVDEDIEEQKYLEEQKKNDNDEFRDYFYTDHNGNDYTKEKAGNKKSGSSLGKWLIVLLILALILIIVWQNIESIKSYFGIQSSQSSSSNDTEPYSNFSVTDTTATVEKETESVATETPASAETAVATTPAKSSYLVSVLNGNGIKGSGAGVSSSLTAAGYTVSNTGNALKFTYINTIIYYKTGKLSVATDIKTVLADRTIELSEDNTISGKYDIVVVVGKN